MWNGTCTALETLTLWENKKKFKKNNTHKKKPQDHHSHSTFVVVGIFSFLVRTLSWLLCLCFAFFFLRPTNGRWRTERAGNSIFEQIFYIMGLEDQVGFVCCLSFVIGFSCIFFNFPSFWFFFAFFFLARFFFCFLLCFCFFIHTFCFRRNKQSVFSWKHTTIINKKKHKN